MEEEDGSTTESECYDELSDEEASTPIKSEARVCQLSVHATAASVDAGEAPQSGANQRALPGSSPPPSLSDGSNPQQPAHAQIKPDESQTFANTIQAPVVTDVPLLEIHVSDAELAQALLAASRPSPPPTKSCARCDARLDLIDTATSGETHATLFCMCCRRPLPMTVFSDVQRDKDNFRRCPSCLRSPRDLYASLVDALPTRLSLTSRVEWCFEQLEQLAEEESAAERVLKDDQVLSEELTAWATSRNGILSRQHAVACQGDGVNAESTEQIFEEWIQNEAESVALRIRQLLAVSAWLETRGVAIPRYLGRSIDALREEIGHSAPKPSSAECESCSAPLMPVAASASKPGYCSCCERLMPSIYFDANEGTCRVCIGGFIGSEPTNLLVRPIKDDWIDGLCRLVSLLRDEAGTSRGRGSEPKLQVLEGRAEGALTRRLKMQLRHQKTLRQGPISVSTSKELYTERVDADEEVVKELITVAAFYIEWTGQLSTQIQSSIAVLHAQRPLPASIMEHVVISVEQSSSSATMAPDTWMDEIIGLICGSDDALPPPSSEPSLGCAGVPNRLIVEVLSPPDRHKISQLFNFVADLKNQMVKISPHAMTDSAEIQAAVDAVQFHRRARRTIGKRRRRGKLVSNKKAHAAEHQLGEALKAYAQVLIRHLEDLGPLPKKAILIKHQLAGNDLSQPSKRKKARR